MKFPSLRTVKQMAQENPALPEGGLRYQIFHEHENGLTESGAIIRVGRKVLIDQEKYFKWLQSQNCKPTTRKVGE